MFSAVTGAGDPGVALEKAIEGLGARYPVVGDTNEPFLAGARALTRHPDELTELLELVDQANFTNLFGPVEATDVLGAIYMLIRGNGSKKHLGAFFTPPAVTQLLAETHADRLRAGAAVYEPTCGTGSMFLAAVNVLRRNGADPWGCGWFGIDLDRVAVAAAGLNSVIWGLGPHVWLHRGDALKSCFVGPGGHPMMFDVVLGNPPFGTKVTLDDGPPELVEVDPVARRAAVGITWTG